MIDREPSDILELVLTGNTTQCPGSSGDINTGCFYYETYCLAGGCSGSTWACTNNLCSYAADCTLNVANELKGCPTTSRAGFPLVSA